MADMKAGAGKWRPRPIEGVADGLVLFDGVCVLCSGWVRFIIDHDPAGRFRFAPVQSPYGAALARRLAIDVDNPETNAVVIGGYAYFKSDAAIAIFSRLHRFGWVRGFAWMPRWLRDRLYDLAARSRYRVFGRTDQCLMPTPELAARFVVNERFVETELPVAHR
jgi:predicted DCC family thiol-disulfide oxidoreductase YuxK